MNFVLYVGRIVFSKSRLREMSYLVPNMWFRNVIFGSYLVPETHYGEGASGGTEKKKKKSTIRSRTKHCFLVGVVV